MTTALIEKQDNIADFKSGVDALLEKRAYFTKRVLPLMVENRDYFVIKNRKSLSKAGAEKLASIYNLVATFTRDKETIDCFGEVEGLVAYVCTLTRNGEVVGQGRGSATLKSHGGDANKTMKMAEKSSYISSVIRSTGLSDIFTTDLEDMDPNLIATPKTPPTPKPTTEAALIPSRDFFGLVDENAWYPNDENEDLPHNNERSDRPMTEKQKSYLSSLILENVSDPEERERWLQEMQGYRISEASETISSFLMSPRY